MIKFMKCGGADVWIFLFCLLNVKLDNNKNVNMCLSARVGKQQRSCETVFRRDGCLRGGAPYQKPLIIS